MYQVGDQVLYGVNGVCNIVAREHRNVDRRRVEYFALEPIHQPEARFYVPTQNPAAVKKLQRILTVPELEALLSSDEDRRDAWIPDESQRKLRYKELINGCDRAALLSMIGTLYRHRQLQVQAGRKFHQCDENFLRDAQKLLESEFSLVLNISRDQIESYIKSRLNVI